MCLGRICCPSGFVLAVETVFGYVIMGKVPVTNTFFTLTDEIPIKTPINELWEIEQVPESFSSNPGDLECETGRLTIALPFKHLPMWLGNSIKIAFSRLLFLENEYNRISGLRLSYNEMMIDFLDQGHMRLVTNET
ncbi:hypothetical protein JTB14_017560 [Gonioctena quinquepunctata]|nr:hypothetical protein JTB14_017560 [Gonioctena quinquepunctata]